MYPHNGPTVLDIPTFIQYGGRTGTATTFQLEAAITIAESQMSEYLHTLLYEARITGSYPIREGDYHVMFEYARTNAVVRVDYFHLTGCAYTPGWHEGKIYSIDDFLGVAVVEQPTKLYSCICGGWQHPRIVYNTGYASGTFADNPIMLMGLTSATQLVLNEMVNPGGGEGYVGIQAWSSMRYSEKRIPLRETPFGSSAQANWIANLVQPWRIHRSRRR